MAIVYLDNGSRIVVADSPELAPEMIWTGPATENPYAGRYPTTESDSSLTPDVSESIQAG